MKIKKNKLIVISLIIVLCLSVVFYIPIGTSIVIDADTILVKATIDEISEGLINGKVMWGEYEASSSFKSHKHEHVYWYLIDYYDTIYNIYSEKTYEKIRIELREIHGENILAGIARASYISDGYFYNPKDPYWKLAPSWRQSHASQITNQIVEEKE